MAEQTHAVLVFLKPRVNWPNTWPNGRTTDWSALRQRHSNVEINTSFNRPSARPNYDCDLNICEGNAFRFAERFPAICNQRQKCWQRIEWKLLFHHQPSEWDRQWFRVVPPNSHFVGPPGRWPGYVQTSEKRFSLFPFSINFVRGELRCCVPVYVAQNENEKINK